MINSIFRLQAKGAKGCLRMSLLHFESSSTKSFLPSLPKDVVLLILGHLDARTLGVLGRVCRGCFVLSREESVWSRIVGGKRGGLRTYLRSLEREAHVLSALFDFQGESADELSFKEGETLTLTHVLDEGWGACVNRDGTFGMVPLNYTESSQFAYALCDSTPKDNGLAFQKGDILHVFPSFQNNDSWLGCMMDGSEGSVRKSDVMLVKRARAVANYTSDGVSFRKGDRVYILRPDGKDENLVECVRRGDRKTGIVPMTWLKYSSAGRTTTAVPGPPFVLQEHEYVEVLCEEGDLVMCQHNGLQGVDPKQRCLQGRFDRGFSWV